VSVGNDLASGSASLLLGRNDDLSSSPENLFGFDSTLRFDSPANPLLNATGDYGLFWAGGGRLMRFEIGR